MEDVEDRIRVMARPAGEKARSAYARDLPTDRKVKPHRRRPEICCHLAVRAEDDNVAHAVLARDEALVSRSTGRERTISLTLPVEQLVHMAGRILESDQAHHPSVASLFGSPPHDGHPA